MALIELKFLNAIAVGTLGLGISVGAAVDVARERVTVWPAYVAGADPAIENPHAAHAEVHGSPYAVGNYGLAAAQTTSSSGQIRFADDDGIGRFLKRGPFQSCT